jgi:hypothetical protein
LNRDQICELYAFLKSLPGPEEKNLAGLNVLKNDIINLLQEQRQSPASLTDTLIEIYRDSARDAVARDYALQHLVTWYEQGAADGPDSKSKILAVLRQGVQGQTSIAGTALLGLHRVTARESHALASPANDLLRRAKTHSDRMVDRILTADATDNEELSHLALAMLVSADSPSPSRIAAILVCAEREVAEALPAIQVMAQADGSTAVRISAIGALGWLGRGEQVALLHRLEAEQNPALGPAIEGALRRLRNRLQQNPAITLNPL